MDGIISNIQRGDYAKHAIIPPPSEFFGDHQSEHRIVIDSRLRDTSLFPNPNNYDIRLEDDITDVIKARLIYLDLPSIIAQPYIIDDNFHTVYVMDNASSVVTAVRLDPGIYATATALETELNAKLASATPSVLAEYDQKTDRFRFSATSPFSIMHTNRRGNLALLLGLKPNVDVASALDVATSRHTVFAPYRWNPSYNDYIIMIIDDFGMLTSIDPRLNNAFSIASRTSRYQQYDVLDRPEYIKRFSPPIARLNRLRVSFYDRFGNLVDFSNQDHRFEMVVTCFKQARKYGNVFAD